MSNDTNTPVDDFEAKLCDALRADAANAPTTDRTWDGPTGTVVSIDGRRRRRPLVLIAAGLTAAAAVATVAIRTSGVDRSVQPVMQPAATVASTVPSDDSRGTQVVLHEVSAGVIESGGVVTFIRSYVLPDSTAVTEYSSLAYVLGTQPLLSHCAGLEVCTNDRAVQTAPVAGPVTFVGPAATKIPVWTWINVPAGTAYVTYTAGGEHLWQAPQNDLVAFPEATDVSDRVVVAHADDGSVLGQVDSSAPSTTAATPFDMPQLTTEQLDQMDALTTSTLGDCLSQRGLTLVTDAMATLAPGADPAAAWQACVTITQQTVRAAVAAIVDDATTASPTTIG